MRQTTIFNAVHDVNSEQITWSITLKLLFEGTLLIFKLIRDNTSSS